jgi:host factor-I protein
MPQAHKLHQDRLLDMAMERDKPITAFLKNGVQVKGRVRAHDTFTILLETEKNITLVYKHSITSVFPARISAGRK